MGLQILKVDPFHPVLGKMVPMVVARIMDYARQYVPEMPPETMASGVMTRLFAGDKDVLVLAVVDDTTGGIVGHLVADRAPDHLNVYQYRMDEGGHGEGLEALKTAEEWLADVNHRTSSKTVLTVTPSAVNRWKGRGFSPARVIMVRKEG